MTSLGDTVGGKYRLEQVIGEGGMGTVFEASHEILGKKVAIKLLRPEFTSRPVEVERFYREAQAAASLGHRSLAEMHDVGWTDDGLPYMVMELLRGETLGQLLERSGGWLEPGAAVGLCDEILSALARVHRADVIHRDLKPANLFIARDEDGAEQLKILDFGISKISIDAADNTLTQDGAIMGTPWYMSPEQARGDPDVDHRADLWAVGAILYETLTGQRPFQGHNFRQICFNIISTPPAAPSQLRPEVAPALEEVVLTALHKDRASRYQSARTFLDELRRATAEERATLPNVFDLSYTSPIVADAEESLDFDDDTPTREQLSPAHWGAAADLSSTPAVPETVVVATGPSRGAEPSAAGWSTSGSQSTAAAEHHDTFAAVVNDESEGSRGRRGMIALVLTGALVLAGGLITAVYLMASSTDIERGPETPAMVAATTPASDDNSLLEPSLPQPAAGPAPSPQTLAPSSPEPVDAAAAPPSNVEPEPPTPEPLGPEEIETALEDLADEVVRCSNPSLRRPVTLEVSLRIAGDGTTEIQRMTPPLPSSAADCLRDLFAGTSFRATGLEAVDATHRYRVGRRRPPRSRRARPRQRESSDLRNNPFGNF